MEHEPTTPARPGALSEADALDAGERLGRFEVLRCLGEGGMGRVYLAFDPELHRQVAVKVLRQGGAAGSIGLAQARARLKREAQAMARVAHPNVVTVYEVDDDRDRVLVVMELVTGGTLRAWAEARPRTVRQVLAMFAEAGAGLAAAHEAGLVHRDFKPENVLVDGRGAARVTDFGLVGADLDAVDLDRTALTGPLALALTHTGAVLGTPTYMAPEQHRGETATARSDQFAFCVALYETLWGRRPFGGDTYRALLAAVIDGEAATPPARPRVPARIRRAILRGLARAPAERFASMQELLAELAPRSRARAGWIAGAAAAVTIGGGAIAFAAWPRDHARSPAPGAAPADARPAPAAPPALPVALTELGGCAEHPIFVDDDTVVFDRSLGDSQDLFTVPARGGTARRITSGPDFHWNPRPGARPDEIYYVRKEMPAGRSHAAVLRNGVSTDLGVDDFDVGPGVAPIAGGVAYVRPDDAHLHLYANGVDRELATLPAERPAYLLGASRDGRWLAIDTAQTKGTCLLDTAAPAPRLDCRTLEGSNFDTWFDRTSAHYYHSSSAGIWRFDRVTGVGALVTPLRVAGDITVSPDERMLVYSDCSVRARLLLLGAEPKDEPSELLAGRFTGPAVGAGDRIVFPELRRDGQVLVVREHDGTTRDLTSPELGSPASPAWDAGATRVVFRLAGKGLYVVDATPRPAVQLTDGTSDIMPRFLDDGRVVFTRLDAQHAPSIWIADPRGGAPARASELARFAWDVDRRTGRVLVSDAAQAHFRWWDPSTGAETDAPAVTAIAAHGIYLGDLAIALDGSAVYANDNEHNLWRAPIAGGAPTKIFTAHAPYDWLDRPVPLSTGVAVNAQYWAGELYRYDLDPR